MMFLGLAVCAWGSQLWLHWSHSAPGVSLVGVLSICMLPICKVDEVDALRSRRSASIRSGAQAMQEGAGAGAGTEKDREGHREKEGREESQSRDQRVEGEQRESRGRGRESER